MAKVPTFGNQVQDNPLPTFRRAALQDTRGQSIGQGLKDVGNVVSRIQAEERQKADASAVFEADMALSQWGSDALLQARSVKGKDAIGLTTKVLPDLDKEIETRTNGIRSNRAKTIFQQQAQQRRLQLSNQFNEIERTETDRYYQDQYLAYRAQEQNAAGLSYRDPKAIADSLDRQDASINVQYGNQPDEVKAIARQEARAKTYSNVFDQLIADEDLTRAKSYFAAIEKDLDTDTAVRVKSSINALETRKASEARAAQAEQRNILIDQVNDAFAMRQLGLPAVLPGRNSFIAAYGDDGAKQYRSAALQWQAYDAAGNASNMAPTQALEYLASFKPATQEGAADTKAGYDLAVQLYAQHRKQLEADPVSILVQTRPELAQLQAAANDDEASAGQYFQKLLATQQALGVESPKLLSESQRDGMAKQLDFDPENPKARANTLAGIKSLYGRYYTDIMREVAPKLEGQARVMIDMNPDQATRLDAAMAQKTELNKLVIGDDESNIKTQLDIEFEDLAITLADNVDAESRLAEYREAAELLAKADVLRGTQPQAAARKAAAAVVNDQYSYIGTMRIPISYDPDVVTDGAAVAQDKVATAGDLSITPGGFSDNAQAQADLQSLIRRQGYWVTNESGTGLVLRIPARTGQGNVYKADGSRIEYTWEQLETAASEKPTRSPFLPTDPELSDR